MKYVDEYRDNNLIDKLLRLIRSATTGEYRFMEVCGGHTAAIRRFGIGSMLPENIRLISGPGCPVCVTGTGFIDKLIACSRMEGVIIATFGDLLRIPGSSSSLAREKSLGADIRIVFSGLEALEIARSESERKIVFPGIGFETTAPGTAATLLEAAVSGAGNFFILSAHKVMPPAMEAIVKEGTIINGFICPGHVATITGASAFSFISEKYKLGCVITGFEPLDILYAIYMLVVQVNSNAPVTQIQYSRAVTDMGNLIAQNLINEVFCKKEEYWRGFGLISDSGLGIREKYSKYDADCMIPPGVEADKEDRACICGEILRGLKTPDECSLFSRICVPENPVGACMVSDEGACHTYYKYTNG
jgi:hydrogenase expression/formation protein HypD